MKKPLHEILEDVIMSDKVVDIYVTANALTEGYTLSEINEFLSNWKRDIQHQYILTNQVLTKDLHKT